MAKAQQRRTIYDQMEFADYVHVAYPKMLYAAPLSGKREPQTCIVEDEEAEKTLLAGGWFDHPLAAMKAGPDAVAISADTTLREKIRAEERAKMEAELKVRLQEAQEKTKAIDGTLTAALAETKVAVLSSTAVAGLSTTAIPALTPAAKVVTSVK